MNTAAPIQTRPATIPEIVTRHFDDSAFLWAQRTRAARGADVVLADLAQIDDRLDAHLDGMRAAGEAWLSSIDVAAPQGPGEAFVAAVLALESHDWPPILRSIRLGEQTPKLLKGVSSAFGWTSRNALQGTVKELLASELPVHRLLGISACSFHRVSAGAALDLALTGSSISVVARAARLCGELGSSEGTPLLAKHLEAEDERIRFWAAWSQVLLGDRQRALSVLMSFATAPGIYRDRALWLTLGTVSVPTARQLLTTLAGTRPGEHVLIQAAGMTGDVHYVPWLITRTEDPESARVAAESLTLITGVNFHEPPMQGKRPTDVQTGPTDDPGDPHVALDEDAGLPWPAPEILRGWWETDSQRFTLGARYFMGEPLNRDNCVRVLKVGYQRQRMAAALYLSLLNPGTPLFECRAPAWRQQRLLAEMN